MTGSVHRNSTAPSLSGADGLLPTSVNNQGSVSGDRCADHVGAHPREDRPAPEHVAAIGLDGNHVAERAPSQVRRLSTRPIYRARPDVEATVHTYQAIATVTRIAN